MHVGMIAFVFWPTMVLAEAEILLHSWLRNPPPREKALKGFIVTREPDMATAFLDIQLFKSLRLCTIA